METIENLVADVDTFSDPAEPELAQVLEVLKSRGVNYTDWAGWLKLNDHELSLGAAFEGPISRERVKVVDRDEQARIAHATTI
jgi:ferredoxin--NADP+ reductase